MNKVSDKGLAFIARHEGIVLDPYLDSATPPVWTIGIGHTASAGEPNPKGHRTITTVEAIEIFRRDVAQFEDRVARHIKVPLAQHEFDALVSFDFNSGGIYYRNKAGKWVNADLVTKLNAGDRAGAAAGFMNWLKPASLYERRKAEQVLFKSGAYGSGDIPLYLAPNGKPMRKGSISVESLLASMGSREVVITPTNPLNPESAWAALWRSIIALLGK